MMPKNLDLDTLRTLIVAQDVGGYSRAAEQLGRTPSAISLQMKRLQEDVGVPLFEKTGRELTLTEHGAMAVRFARRILDLNDEMLDNLRGAALTGIIRIGFAQDFVDTVMPEVLTSFNARFPLVRLEIKVDRDARLEEGIDNGSLDVALTLGDARFPTATKIGEMSLVWISSSATRLSPKKPLPLVLFEHPCVFRTIALDALDRVQRKWHITLTTPSTTGLWASVSAGLGVTVRPRNGAVSEGIVQLKNLPPLGTVNVTMHRRASATTSHVSEFIELLRSITTKFYGPTGGSTDDASSSLAS